MAGKQIVGVFDEVESFEKALAELLSAGFEPRSVSILAEHRIISDHFGGDIPDAAQLADRTDTPKETLGRQELVRSAVHLIAEGASLIGMIGAAGLAYFMGGPVGVASAASDATEPNVERVLSHRIDQRHAGRYRQSIRDGGVVCWVRVHGAQEQARASGILGAHNGQHVHAVDA